jgi:hypothetical protein
LKQRVVTWTSSGLSLNVVLEVRVRDRMAGKGQLKSRKY